MRPSLATRLGEIRDAYIRDLDSRSAARREEPAVRLAKENILVALTAIDSDPPASATLPEQVAIKNKQLAQIEEKLALLDRIEFGDSADLSADGTQRFKRSQLAGGTGVIGVIKGIVSALAGMLHFEDVITNARAMLLAERNLLRSQIAANRQILCLSTPEVIATRPHLTPESIARCREASMGTAMADFARNTYLGKENYKNAGGSDEAHTAAMKSRILAFTGETAEAVGSDFTKGYAGVITHTAAQTFGGPLIEEFLDHVPNLDSREGKSAAYMPTWGRNQLRWSEATDGKGGFFIDIETQVLAVHNSSGQFYAANPDPTAGAPMAVLDDDVGGISSDHNIPPLFTLKARLRYTLPAPLVSDAARPAGDVAQPVSGAASPVGQVEVVEIASRYPTIFPFSEADRAYVIDTTHLSAPAAGADVSASATADHRDTPAVAGAGAASASAPAPVSAPVPAAGGAGAPLPNWLAAAGHTASSPAPATGETAGTDDEEDSGESGAPPSASAR